MTDIEERRLEVTPGHDGNPIADEKGEERNPAAPDG
jgi:hypothetical protein